MMRNRLPNRNQNTLKDPQHGFTLIEAMVVVAIIGILATLAVPSYRNFIKENALTGASEEMLTSLMYAHSEAIKRSKTVTLCNSASPTAATPICKADNPDWKTGWVVFIDNDGDKTFNGNDEVLRVSHDLSAIDSLLATNDTVAITFRSTLVAGGTDTTFTFCSPTIKQRLVTVDKMGRVSRTVGSICS